MKTKSKPSLVLLSALLAVTACSKTVKETNYVPVKEMNSISVSNSKTDIESLKKLLKSDAPNLALIELLAKSVAKEHRDEVRKIFADLTAEEAKAIIEKVEKDNRSIRNNYLYHGQVYKDNKNLLKSSLLDEAVLADQQFSVEHQLKTSAFGYVKSKALDEIVAAYDKRANQLANELANDIAMDIGQSNPEDARKIENAVKGSSMDEVIKMIQKSKPVVEKIDQHFRSSKLNENEQYVVTISAVIAGSIYMQVKDKQSFKRILAEGKRIAQDIKEFKAKADEFILLVNTLAKHTEQTAANYRDLREGMRGAKDDLSVMFEAAKKGMNNSSNVHSRRIVDFLHTSLFSGKEGKPDSNSSIFSKQVSFNENFKKSLNAASNLTSNLTAIVQTTQAMSKLLGIKPSKDLQRVLKTAQDVSNVINVVKAGVAGFATGGYIGAIAAVGGPMMSMMGGGGSADSAKLDEISRKLDIVLENQRRMMEMQLETMNMIKELAYMVDEYHQREMTALAELRDYSLVQLEMNKTHLNKDIRQCERMIGFQLKSVWKKYDNQTNPYYSVNNVSYVNRLFTENVIELQNLGRISLSVEEDGYKSCQTGIAEAFGGVNTDENPIRAIFATTDDENLFRFQRETYAPLVTSLEYFAETSDFDSIPLHIPSATYQSLEFKKPYIDSRNPSERSNEVYDLENLLSVRNLERYLSNLLILHPLLDLDKSVWQKSYDEIVTTYIENSNTENNQNSRSHYFLSNALKMVQSSIAQEALLAGEPIIHRLQDRYIEDIFSSADCSTIKRTDVPVTDDVPFFCAIRNNRLLMKNLVQLHLNMKLKDISFLDKYEDAFKKGDKEALAKLLDIRVTADRLEVTKKDDQSEITLNVVDSYKQKIAVKLPTTAALKEGRIIYSENMPRLLKMQNLILDGLEKVTPVKRDHKDKDLLKLLLVGV